MGGNAAGAYSMKFASVLSMKRLVLGCLCGVALAGGGCTDGVGAPTRPSASTAGTAAGSSLQMTTVAAGDAAAKVHGQLPFHGSLEATDTDTVAFPFLSVHLTGTGNATHLGNYAATFDFRIDLRTPTSPAVGSFTLTAADGDSIFGDLVGRASIADGVATVVETATITGGTGRFTEATGSFTIARTVVQATGISSGSFDGTIDLHK
jgi:hypothetical protein